MHESLRINHEHQANAVIGNLRKNRMEAFYVKKASDVCSKVKELLHEGDTVAAGGSMTLDETGVTELLRSGRYRFIDRNIPGLDPAAVRKIYLDSFDADVYLTSANAITLKGELFNVDGRSNRVASICYGPKSVIVIAGINKIVPDIQSAVRRVRLTAAPSNCVRLAKKTYCASTGYCQGIDKDDITAGCSSPDRICCSYLISAMQQEQGRIKVIIVGEDLGF
ncbi:MAG: lactate utilization protein [Saccharofermentanales bacterium]